MQNAREEGNKKDETEDVKTILMKRKIVESELKSENCIRVSRLENLKSKLARESR